MARKALVTGVTGQDGSYMAEFLLKKGYEVYGMVRRVSTDSHLERIQHLKEDIHIVEGDLSDQTSLNLIVKETAPDEVYHLAAQAFVPASWNQAIMTSDITGAGVTRVLDAVRMHGKSSTKVFNPSSCVIFGKVKKYPQNEQTPICPNTPYAVTKAYGYWMTINYREHYKIFASNSISYNHESPRRGLEFVSRKITDGVARIKKGISSHITLGDLNAQKDWGFAGDYIEAYWLMLQQDKPDDFIIATGELRSVQDVVETAFAAAGMRDWKNFIKQDPRFMRTSDETPFVGDITKAKAMLKWKPRTSFKELITMMVREDLKRYGVQ